MSESVTFTSAKLRLAASRFGDPAHPPVLLLHGAGQTRHAWRHAAAAIAGEGWCAISLDARGHGDSDWSSEGDYSIDVLITDLLTVIDSCTQKPVIVGASLGGITALLAQGEASKQILRALILVDITPRIDPTGVERIIGFMRRYSEGFASVQAAASAVAAYQPRRSKSDEDANGLRKNLRRGADGRYYWHWDPKLLNHVSDLDTQAAERLQRAAQALSLPTLLVHGKMSDIVSDETAREFLKLVPHASYADVADAAHMVAGDSNERFNGAVLAFLRQLQNHETF